MGKFLGFMVSKMEIKANLEKIQVIVDITSPRNLNEVQKLASGIITLNRFISRSTDKCLLFFKTLQKHHEWNDECNKAFKQLKAYLSNPHLLSQTKQGDYVTISLTNARSGKHDISEGRRKNTDFDVILQSSLERIRGEIAANGATSTRLGDGSVPITTIILGTCHEGTNNVSTKKGLA